MTHDASIGMRRERTIRFALANGLVIGLLLGAVVPAQAACQQWAASSTYSINQQKKIAASPIEFYVQFRMNPGSGQLTGDAEYRPSASRSSPTPEGKGSASGFIRGNQIEITANWGSHSVGVYSGTIDAEGHASGTVRDKVNPSFRMEWHSAVPLYCAVALDVDRPGGDYRNFDLSAPSHDACLAACIGDTKCKAYTYVKPGMQGASAHCWLKDSRPYASANGCCVSGIIRGGSTATTADKPKPIKQLGKQTGPTVPNLASKPIKQLGKQTAPAVPNLASQVVKDVARPSGPVTQYPRPNRAPIR
jgi:hypothetical protein